MWLGEQMTLLEEWSQKVRNRTDSFNGLSVTGMMGGAGASWSSPFRVVASDGRQYFVKSREACPAGQENSLVIENVVASAGRLIGAPVCETSLIRIPEEFRGYELKSGVTLSPGLAHASLALEHADEADRPALGSRGRDDNNRRHVGVYALYNWCFGDDAQWLYDLDNDRTIHSHDHGLYLPPPGTGTFDKDSLVNNVNVSKLLPDPTSGLMPSAIEETINALRRVDRGSLVSILSGVPASWPVSDELLETLGWFLENRIELVVEMLESLV